MTVTADSPAAMTVPPRADWIDDPRDDPYQARVAAWAAAREAPWRRAWRRIAPALLDALPEFSVPEAMGLPVRGDWLSGEAVAGWMLAGLPGIPEPVAIEAVAFLCLPRKGTKVPARAFHALAARFVADRRRFVAAFTGRAAHDLPADLMLGFVRLADVEAAGRYQPMPVPRPWRLDDEAVLQGAPADGVPAVQFAVWQGEALMDLVAVPLQRGRGGWVLGGEAYARRGTVDGLGDVPDLADEAPVRLCETPASWLAARLAGETGAVWLPWDAENFATRGVFDRAIVVCDDAAHAERIVKRRQAAGRAATQAALGTVPGQGYARVKIAAAGKAAETGATA